MNAEKTSRGKKFGPEHGELRVGELRVLEEWMC